MLIVAALGGNALLQRGQPLDAEVQRRNVKTAAAAIAMLIDAGHDLVVTHGNGPQVGLLALQSEAFVDVATYPLDVLGAQTEGMIGYLLEQELANQLQGQPVATLLTQVVVDPADPAFTTPTKPIGPSYPEAVARRLAEERGWAIAADGDGFRRVVASPDPVRIVEVDTIALLVAAKVVVVCAGGGGVPVIERRGVGLMGVEAVVDKDRSAALLAQHLRADALLLLTDADAVYTGWGTPAAKRIRRAHPDEIDALSFPAGSMGPKVGAACQFARATGRLAAIGALADAPLLVAGAAGTTITTTAIGLV